MLNRTKAVLIYTHRLLLLKENLENFFCEEEKVEASENHGRFGYVEVHQRVETEGLTDTENNLWVWGDFQECIL